MSEEMSREQAIGVITMHREHWRRLLQGNVCSKAEGEESIASFDLAIAALSAEPMRWIPVEEKLPEESGIYLVTRHIPFHPILEILRFEKDFYYHQDNDRYAWIDDKGDYPIVYKDSISAWWPRLPKAYCGKEQE